jgi:O-antigen/teichoic acid export membrane protein
LNAGLGPHDRYHQKPLRQQASQGPVTEPADGGSIAGNAARVLSARIAANTGYFVGVLLLARGLSPAGRGTVAFITVTALVTARVSSIGLSEATMVFAAKRPGARAVLLSTTVIATAVSAVAGAVLICGGLALIPGARPAGVGGSELVLLGLGALGSAIAVAGYSFLQGSSRFRPYTQVLGVAPWLYALLLGVIWAAAGLTVTRAVTAWVLAEVVAATLLCGASARGIGFGRPDLHLLREAIRFGVRAWFGGLARFLNARVDQIIMGLIASEAALGIYAVAVNGSEVLFYIPSAVAAALVPAVASGGAGAPVERTLRVFRLVAVVTVAAVGVAAVAGPLLLPLVFGEPYRDSVIPFLWLLPSALGFAASSVFSNALLASSAPTLSSVGPVVSLTLGIALDLLLIPRYGASGAAAAASVALLAGGAVAATVYRRRAEVPLGALIPRRADFAALPGLARRALRWAGSLR